MKVYFNKEAIETSSEHLEAFIKENGWADKTGIAVAVNESVIPKSNWANTQIQENDNILVITATQGG